MCIVVKMSCVISTIVDKLLSLMLSTLPVLNEWNSFVRILAI
jgi:hypothetical protein